jgi:hypothetical protein
LKANYETNISPHLRVRISKNFQSFFFADVDEKIIVERKEDYVNQATIPGLKGKYVKFIIEDLQDNKSNGFFFVCCGDYGDKLLMEHTHISENITTFNHDIEPDCIDVFDVLYTI